MTTLFSYVVEHDYGIAPNPSDGLCTLVKCKFKKSNRKNILELAKEGDWIVGTGGANKKKSAGHRKIVYLMRVDEKLPIDAYTQGKRFSKRIDSSGLDRNISFALISHHFFYFGNNAIHIDSIPSVYPHPLEKKGPGFRKDFSQEFIVDFTNWFEKNYEVGVYGIPCGKINKLIQI